MFDNGYEPSDCVMLAELGDYYHFVSLDGKVVRTFPLGTRVKPMRSGETIAYYTNGEQERIKAAELLHNFDK